MEKLQFKSILPEVVDRAKPSLETLKRIGEVSFIMTVGPSGAGKSTVMDKMDKLKYPFVVSDTTRSARANECNGIHYNFRTDYERLLEEIESGEFVEAEVGAVGDFYGTKAAAYPESGLCIKALTARKIWEFRQLGFKSTVTAAIVPPSHEELMRRVGAHHLTEEELYKRSKEAKESLGLSLEDPLTVFILNDKVSDASVQLKHLVEYDAHNYSRKDRGRRAAIEVHALL